MNTIHWAWLCTVAFAVNVTGAPVASPIPSKSPHAWMDSVSPKKAGDFPPMRPLIARYSFGWSGIEAGRGVFAFSQPDKKHLQLKTSLSSTGLARLLWSMDGTADATAVREGLRPVQFEQIEKYRNNQRKTNVTFQNNSVLYSFRKTPSKKPPGKPKRIAIDNGLDLHTALLWVRSQPLKNSDTITMIVIPSGSPYLATVTVTGRETIKVPAGHYPAIKLDLQLREIGKDFTLKPFKSFRRTTGWISDDKDRLLLKVDSDLSFGSIFCELTSVEPKSK